MSGSGDREEWRSPRAKESRIGGGEGERKGGWERMRRAILKDRSTGEGSGVKQARGVKEKDAS
jgi:hypothetical protein